MRRESARRRKRECGDIRSLKNFSDAEDFDIRIERGLQNDIIVGDKVKNYRHPYRCSSQVYNRFYEEKRYDYGMNDGFRSYRTDSKFKPFYTGRHDADLRMNESYDEWSWRTKKQDYYDYNYNRNSLDCYEQCNYDSQYDPREYERSRDRMNYEIVYDEKDYDRDRDFREYDRDYERNRNARNYDRHQREKRSSDTSGYTPKSKRSCSSSSIDRAEEMKHRKWCDMETTSSSSRSRSHSTISNKQIKRTRRAREDTPPPRRLTKNEIDEL